MVYKPTDRERQRYVVYEGSDPVPTFMTLFGVMGASDAGMQRRASNVIRVVSDAVDRVKAAIALTQGCRSIRVTSTLNTART